MTGPAPVGAENAADGIDSCGFAAAGCEGFICTGLRGSVKGPLLCCVSVPPLRALEELPPPPPLCAWLVMLAIPRNDIFLF